MRFFRRFRKSIPPASPPPPQTVVLNGARSSPLINDLNNSHSSPQSNTEIRHKSEIEIEIKEKSKMKMSPLSTSSCSPIVRSRDLNTSRTPSLTFDENSPAHFSQTPKRRIFSNSIPTQTPSLLIQTNGFNNDKYLQMDKMHSILKELANCQSIIQQQEQQVINMKKERDHFSLLVDERTNDLCNLKLKNEQLEQMIRNGKEHRHEQEQLQRIDQQIKSYKVDAVQMHEQILSLTIQLEEISQENQRLQEENQNYQAQIEYERNKADESNSFLDIELEQTRQMLRSQRNQLENHCQIFEGKYRKDLEQLIEEKNILSKHCDDLVKENHRLENALTEKDNDYEKQLNIYREKNTFLSTKVDELEKKLTEAKKQFESVILEKDETLADMLVAVRVASELRHDAEDRLNKANDDLKRITERERAMQRRQLSSSTSNGDHTDIGQIKIKEMIRTLEANSLNLTNSNTRQRPLSQPCTRAEAQAMLTHRPKQSTRDGGKSFTSTERKSSMSLNTSSRSITSEQYDEMKTIIETVLTRIPGSVCKRDALLKWCRERLAKYNINITNFSNCWIDGMAFCALLHSYLPDRIDLEMIKIESKKKRFERAFQIASSIGIVSILNVEEMCSSEWPDWERVMYYVALIFRHFEGSSIMSSPTMSPPLIFNSVRSSNEIPKMLCSPLQTV